MNASMTLYCRHFIFSTLSLVYLRKTGVCLTAQRKNSSGIGILRNVLGLLRHVALGLLALGSLPLFADEPVWKGEWDSPSAQNRPLQIIHGRTLDETTCAYFRDTCGLGGVVVSVPAENGYVQNEANWAKTAENITAALQASLRVWFYDELAWPSLSAGGATLARNPALESLELAWDKDAPEPFTVRTSYEYTFASMDKLRQALRHPNPLDPAATETFLDTTHRKLRETLGADLYHRVEAFFTDEPTLLGFSLLPILTPQEREKYRVADPLDWSKPILPTVVWRDGLEQLYAETYGSKLDKNALFTGQSDEAKKVRRNFWSLIGQLNADSYFGTIRRYCESDAEGPVASGHTLCEESLSLAVPVDGNKLEVLKEFQLPGQDLLNSEPKAQLEGHWATNALPVSAAYFIGQRRVMTEISDHIQRHSSTPRLASLDEMCAAAGIMASWGITEFTLYYSINGAKEFPYRTEATHHAYCDFVGRLNSILRTAEPVRPLLLYYPIEIMQEEYLPMAGTIQTSNYSEKAKATDRSFRFIGIALSKAQIPFLVVDKQTLGELAENEAGSKNPHSRTVRKLSDFSGLILSANAPEDVSAGTLPRFCADGNEAAFAPETIAETLASAAGPRLLLDPPTQEIALGAFVRDNALIFTLVHTGSEPWSGTARLALPSQCAFSDGRFHFGQEGTIPFGPDSTLTRLNPATGEIAQPEKLDSTAAMTVTIEPNETAIFIVEPK